MSPLASRVPRALLALAHRSLAPSTARTVKNTTRAMSTDAKFSFGAEQAAYYDSVLAEGIFKPWCEKMFEVSRAVTGERVLDVATGTGIVARELARAVGAEGGVTAMDNAPGMLARARAASATGARVTYVEGDACDAAHEERAFDRAYCQQGLQFMSDPTEAMRRVRAALKPGGHFTAAVWTTASATSNPIIYHLGEALREVGREDWVPVAVKPMSWSASDAEGSTKLEDCLISAGFINPDVSREDGTFDFPSLDVAVDIAKVGPYGFELSNDAALWSAFAANFKKRLAPYVLADGRVSAPARSFIAHGVAPWN